MSFSNRLITWYRNNKRNLPWRDTTDPYLIWLSEIILQQTRVEQGLPYFAKFSEEFPTVKLFSEASEDKILQMWQGLGYYSRGRNMLKTAKKVVEDFNGVFPNSYEHLITLTGIGAYTAAAISSFSNNEAKAVVDGNVYRFLARYFGIETPINSNLGKKEFQAIADDLLDINNAGEHNQAMIEFGALQCKPSNPNCAICDFMIDCHAYKHQKVNSYPVKIKKLKIKERYFYYFILINTEQEILIKRRDNSDIWAGLYDLPSLEFSKEEDLADVIKNSKIANWNLKNHQMISVSPTIKHILTHQRIYARFVEIDLMAPYSFDLENAIWVKLKDLPNYGMPKLIFAFMKNFIN